MPACGLSCPSTASAKNEWETFYNLITHDDRNSYYIVSSLNHGSWNEIAVKKQNLAALGFNKGINYYITHNGFTSTSRKANTVRQLNSMFFDLDCHGHNNKTTRQAVQNTIIALNKAAENGSIPKPTMTVDTGRGLQLYYVLEKSIPFKQNSEAIFNKTSNVKNSPVKFFTDIQNRLFTAIKQAVANVKNIEVDQATSDHSRVSRVPGTYNTKAKCLAKLVSVTNNLYSLKQLKQNIDQGNKINNQQKYANKCKFRIKQTVNQDNLPLLNSRLTKIKELQAYRKYKCEGNRELMCFVFYNTAVQLYKKEIAKKQLEIFNSNFIKPLSKTELKGCTKSVDKVVNYNGQVGYYLISASKLVQLLNLTPIEIEELNFFETKRTIQRKQQKKSTKEKRKKRDNIIVNLYLKAKLTQKEIANKVKCSIRTVASVLAKKKKQENKKLTKAKTPKVGAKQTSKKQTSKAVCKKLSYELGVSCPACAIACFYLGNPTISYAASAALLTKLPASTTLVTFLTLVELSLQFPYKCLNFAYKFVVYLYTFLLVCFLYCIFCCFQIGINIFLVLFFFTTLLFIIFRRWYYLIFSIF